MFGPSGAAGGASALGVGMASVVDALSVLTTVVSALNGVYVDQVGTTNSGTISQTGIANSVGGPTFVVQQTASASDGGVPAYGGATGGNQLTVTQAGLANLVGPLGGLQAGAFNRALFTQAGIGNLVSHFLQDGAGSLLSVVQGGTGAGGPGNAVFDVRQSGSVSDGAGNVVGVSQIGTGNGYFANDFSLETENYRAATYFGVMAPVGGVVFNANVGRPSSGARVVQQTGRQTAALSSVGVSNSFDVYQSSGVFNSVSNRQAGDRNYLYAAQIGLSNTVTNAQTGNYNVMLVHQGAEFAFTPGDYAGNGVDFSQAGNRNWAEVLQLGSQNVVTGSQQSDRDLLLVAQNGTGNRIEATQAVGNDNVVQARQAGMQNGLAVLQSGSGNNVNSAQTGNFNLAGFTQSGNNNKIISVQR
jgi:hypothetical protein